MMVRYYLLCLIIFFFFFDVENEIFFIFIFIFEIDELDLMLAHYGPQSEEGHELTNVNSVFKRLFQDDDLILFLGSS